MIDDLKQRLRATQVLAEYENGGTLEQVRNPDGAEAAAALDAKDAEIAALKAERDELLDDVKAFLPMWAIEYARRAEMPEGHLHPQHYDRMAQIGCRMVAFTRVAVNGGARANG